MKTLCILLAVAPLAACATTAPLSGGSVDYHLPRTDGAVTLALDLTSCTPIKVVGELALAAKAGAQDQVQRIAGEALASSRIKRDLAITLSDKGVIKSINADNAERTPQIIGSSLKTVMTLAASAPGAVAPLKCEPSAEAALKRADFIEKEIVALRQELARPTPWEERRRKVKDIDLLAKELGALRAGPLRVEIKSGVKLDKLGQGDLEIGPGPFAKWFGSSASDKVIARQFGLTWTASQLDVTPVVVGAGRTRSLRKCNLALPTPNPVVVKVSVAGKQGSALERLKAEEAFPAAQLASANQLCIDVGFGEARTIKLAFDEFGRTTEFTWSSAATAETVSGAVAGYATDATALYGSLRGKSDLQKQKDEIDRIKTQNELDALRACEAAKAAGGACTD